MPDRRKGPTIFWEYFWKIIHGERRSGKDRRAQRPPFQPISCAGSCDQGRRPCDCRLDKEKTE